MRTVIALAVIAASLLGFIVVFERDTVSDGELASRRGRVLANFIRDRVSHLEISTPKGRVTLEKRADPDGVMPIGIWHVTSPYKALADGDAVDALLGELEWMDARRRITNVTKEDRARFGVDTPIATVDYRVGRDRGTLSLGGPSPKGDGNYLMTGDGQTAFVVGKDLSEALKFAPLHFHTKFLHKGLMLGTAKKITIQKGDQAQVVVKRDGRWWLKGETPSYASKPRLQTFIQGLDRLLAQRVVELSPVSTKKYGLNPPNYSVSIHRRVTRADSAGNKEGAERFEDKTILFSLGDLCADGHGERYLRVERGPVVCVSEAEFAQTQQAIEDLEELRLAPIVPANIDRVEITRGNRKLVLKYEEDHWSYQSEEHAEAVEAEPQTVESMLAKLAAALPVDTLQKAVTLHERGTIVRLFRKGIVTVDLQASTQDGRLRVRRAGESGERNYPPDLSRYLTPRATEYRIRKLLNYGSGTLKRVSVTLGDNTRVAEAAADGRFRLPKQNGRVADTVTMQTLGRLLGELEATRFVTDRNEWPVVGRVALIFLVDGSEHSHELLLSSGPNRDEMRARLDGGFEFVLHKTLAEKLGTTWAKPAATSALNAN